MEVVINGRSEAGDFTTVGNLLRLQNLDPCVVVVELNRKILPAADFDRTFLKEGDTVEIVQFVAGG